MTIDLLKSDLVVAVFGAGTMGRGIAQVCAQAGMTTLLYDARDGAVAEALAAVDKGLDGQVAKGRMTDEAKRDTMARLKADQVDRRGRVGRSGDRSDCRRPRRQARAVPLAGKDAWRPTP